MSGDFYCWQGFCTADNGWTVPAKFEVKHIYIYILDELVFKVLDVEAQAMLVAEMAQCRIAGVVGNAKGGVAPPWWYLGECIPEGNDVIKVFFGDAVIAPTIVEPETHECPDLQGVGTPPSPRPRKTRHQTERLLQLQFRHRHRGRLGLRDARLKCHWQLASLQPQAVMLAITKQCPAWQVYRLVASRPE